ncbi:MAG: sigma-70 family RNA polymerase sigma factor [bacterium]|jgi:RNA polymerase sporulation-specific sigma factor
MNVERLVGALFKCGFLDKSLEAGLWRDYSPESRARLILAYQPLVAAAFYRIAPPEAYAEDCLSEGLLALVRAADRFSPSRGVPFAAFARIAIRGAMIDYLRRVAPVALASEELDAAKFARLSLDDGDPAVDRLASVLAALERLPEKERRVLAGLYLDDRPRSEIAKELGVSGPRVSQIHAKAVRRLRAMLKPAPRRRRFSLANPE